MDGATRAGSLHRPFAAGKINTSDRPPVSQNPRSPAPHKDRTTTKNGGRGANGDGWYKTKLMSELTRHKLLATVSTSAQAVFQIIVAHGGRNAYGQWVSWPSVGTICEEQGRLKERQVRRLIKELEQARLILVHRPDPKSSFRGRETNTYVVIAEELLEQAVQADAPAQVEDTAITPVESVTPDRPSMSGHTGRGCQATPVTDDIPTRSGNQTREEIKNNNNTTPATPADRTPPADEVVVVVVDLLRQEGMSQETAERLARTSNRCTAPGYVEFIITTSRAKGITNPMGFLLSRLKHDGDIVEGFDPHKYARELEADAEHRELIEQATDDEITKALSSTGMCVIRAKAQVHHAPTRDDVMSMIGRLGRQLRATVAQEIAAMHASRHERRAGKLRELWRTVAYRRNEHAARGFTERAELICKAWPSDRRNEPDFYVIAREQVITDDELARTDREPGQVDPWSHFELLVSAACETLGVEVPPITPPPSIDDELSRATPASCPTPEGQVLRRSQEPTTPPAPRTAAPTEKPKPALLTPEQAEERRARMIEQAAHIRAVMLAEAEKNTTPAKPKEPRLIAGRAPS